MFTGIVQAMGTIGVIEKEGDWIFEILAPETACEITVGASVACSGVCLTVIEATAEAFRVQVSGETLSKTTLGGWAVGQRINLERALRMGDELGGHWVSGHVDGVARVILRENEKDSIRFVYEAPQALAAFLAPKGSVCLDGISLTINDVDGACFSANIIPHTQNVTTMGAAQVGTGLNMEIDLIARYVGRILAARGLA